MVTYAALHLRVQSMRGKASSCYNRELGLRDCTSTNYGWSQLHHTDGMDPLDYVSLCYPCHWRYDDKGGRAQGSKHGNAILTEAIVRECRLRWDEGRQGTALDSIATLAKEFGINPATMGDAVNGRTWKHVKLI